MVDLCNKSLHQCTKQKDHRKANPNLNSIHDVPGILLVGNHLSRSGVTPSVGEEMSKHLRSAGYVVILTSTQRNSLSRLTDMLWTTWNQKDRYQIAQVDVFSGRGFFWAEMVCRVLRWLNKPYILVLRGGNLPIFSSRNTKRVKRLLSSANEVVAPSNYLSQAMQSYCAQISVIPQPLNLTAYPFRLRLSVTPTLVWLRAFHAIYNPQQGPRLLAALQNRNITAHMTMFGPDKGDGSLQKTLDLAHQLDVNHLLQIPGVIAKQDVPTYLNDYDIFVNTTFIDNTPVSVMEAMACGLCVVSTNVGGIPYLLEHEKDSLLVIPDDPEQMASAIQRLLTEPTLCAQISSAARRKAEAHDTNSVLHQWRELISRVSQCTYSPNY